MTASALLDRASLDVPHDRTVRARALSRLGPADGHDAEHALNALLSRLDGRRGAATGARERPR